MKFKFKAIKLSGERYEGIAQSKNKFSLYNEFKNEGSILISAEEIKNNSVNRLFSKSGLSLNRVSPLQKISLAKNLSSMLKAGLSLSRALSVIEKQTGHGYFQDIVIDLNSEIKAGRSLSEALKKYPKIFSNLFVAMTKAGEESGSLVEALANVALQAEKVYRLQKKIKGALIYPGVIVSAMLLVGILMFIFVVPGLTATFKDLDTALPFSTQLVISFSDFLSTNWLLTIFILIAVVGGLIILARSKIGHLILDNILVRLPLIGDLVVEANTARTMRTFSSLLLAGVPVSDSLIITTEVVDNHLYKKVINEALMIVEKGESISTVFEKNYKLYPAFVGEMVSVGEETGNLGLMLSEVAAFYENDVEERTKDLSTIIEPILMIIIGVAVGFFALSMITPIYSVMDKI